MKSRLRVEQEQLIPHRPLAAKRDLKPDFQIPDGPANSTSPIIQMQKAHGNAFVRRFLNQVQSTPDARSLVSRDAKHGSSQLAPYKAHTPGAYLTATINGAEVKGSSLQPGHKGKIDVLNLSAQIPQKDVAKRSPGGKAPKRDPTSVKFITELAPEIAEFQKALLKNSPVDVRFEFVKVNMSTRLEEVYATFEQKHARVASVTFSSGEFGRGMAEITLMGDATDDGAPKFETPKKTEDDTDSWN